MMAQNDFAPRAPFLEVPKTIRLAKKMRLDGRLVDGRTRFKGKPKA